MACTFSGPAALTAFETSLSGSSMSPKKRACAQQDDVRFRIEGARAVRAGRHAGAAADALFLVDENLAVFRAVGGLRRAHLHAGRVLAVLADVRKEVLLDVGEDPRRTDRVDLVQVHAERHAVFLFAGDFAGHAPRAAVEVDNQSFLRHNENSFWEAASARTARVRASRGFERDGSGRIRIRASDSASCPWAAAATA